MTFPEGWLDLFVVEIGEPADQEFRITVANGHLGREVPLSDVVSKSDVSMANVDLGMVQPIEVTSQSRIFQFHWTDYIAYNVRNESFWALEDGEPKHAGNFYTREKSAFLDFVSATTFASDDYPGPLTHWALETLNHCIAVVSSAPPIIRELDLNDRNALLIRTGWLKTS